MTHRPSVNGTSRLIAPVPAPAAAQRRHLPGIDVPTGDIRLIGFIDGQRPASPARNLNVRVKEVLGKK